MTSIDTSLGRIGLSTSGSGGVPPLVLHGVRPDRTAPGPELPRVRHERLQPAAE